MLVGEMKTTALALACAAALGGVRAEVNVVLYVTDDVGVTGVLQDTPELSFADDPAMLEAVPEARRINTPTLAKLAREGKRMLRSYAASPVCGPSRHSFMTGVQTGIQDIRGNGFGPDGVSDVNIGPEKLTIAEALKTRGYNTGAFGKWAMAVDEASPSGPCKRGFDTFTGQVSHARMGHAFPEEVATCKAGEDAVLHELPANRGASKEKCHGPDAQCVYFDWHIREAALDFVREQSADTPFFLYWATSAGHSALYEQVAKHGNCRLKTHPVPSFFEYTEEALAGTGRNTEAVRGLMAMITHTVDEDLAQLLTALDERGLESNTLIIFTSDNGPHREAFEDADYDPLQDVTAAAGLRGIKRRLYEGGVRVPTIAWWPGTIPAGSESRYPFMLYDLPLTIADAAGIASDDPVLAPFRVDRAGGLSLLSLLKSSDDAPAVGLRDWAYVEICFTSGGSPLNQVCPVRWSRSAGCAYAYYDLTQWPSKLLKLVVNEPDGDAELFDLVVDPMETNDLAPGDRATVAALQSARDAVRSTECVTEDGPECRGDPCTFFESQDSCTDYAGAKCMWSRRRCSAASCSDQDDEAACAAFGGCTWRPWLGRRDRCAVAPPPGAAHFCETYADDSRGCRRDRDCSWSDGECVPQPCDGRSANEDVCLAGAGCGWRSWLGRRDRCVDLAAPRGGENYCSTYLERRSCSRDAACNWNDEGDDGVAGSCQPAPCTARHHSKDVCMDGTGCMWRGWLGRRDRCVDAPPAGATFCSTYDESRPCGRDRGCEWRDGACWQLPCEERTRSEELCLAGAGCKYRQERRRRYCWQE